LQDDIEREEAMSEQVKQLSEEVKQLSDGTEVPVLALGVWQIPEGDECVNAVQWALEAGYRHVDTAQAYGNERSVGEGIRRSGVPRDEVFVTTKFNPSQDDPVAAAEQSLERLGIETIDLYIIHWPAGGATWAWPGMEQAKERGYARSIGVSNFNVRELDEVVGVATEVPTVNQIHLNPFAYRRELLAACERHGIAAEAYSPLGTGRHLADPEVGRIAAGLGKTPAQVLLRWALQHGFILLPKSTHKERIEENGAIFDFALSDEDMAALDALDRTGGTGNAVESKWWR
jgi:diketogulonate reductase-like aldo/keto reductase